MHLHQNAIGDVSTYASGKRVSKIQNADRFLQCLLLELMTDIKPIDNFLFLHLLERLLFLLVTTFEIELT